MRTKDIATIIATFSVIILIIWYLSPEKLLRKIGEISIEILFLLIVLYALDISIRVVRMHILVSSLGYEVSYIPLFHAVAATLFVNSCTPARAGELVRLHVLREEYDIPYAEGLAAIVVEHVLNIIAILTLAICSFLYVREEYTIDPAVESLLLIGVIFISIFNFFLISMAFWGDRLAPIFRFFGPLQDKLLSFFLNFQQGLAALRKSGFRNIFLCVLLSFFVWLIEATMIFLLANDLAEGSNVSFVLATLASVLGNLTYIFPILPGSIGTYELAIAVVFLLVDLEEKTGVLIAAIDHGFKVVFLAIVGGYATAKLGVDFVFRRELNHKRTLSASEHEKRNDPAEL
ncbi:MAG: YbhN family protein [Candidatus Heimdallarchaeota archaeon]